MSDEAKLKILIEAHNRAQKAFDEVNSQVEKTERRFSSMSDKLEKVGSKMKDIGGKMTTTLTLPILAGAGLAVKAFSDLNETINKVDVSFGNSAGAVKAWSKDSIKSMGLAQQSALDAAALFGDMGTGMGQTQVEASKMSMSLTQLGADMASFKNVSFERAQTALAGVYTGETEALKSLGIVMTEANLEAFAQSQGIKKNIKDMTQAEKVQLRYAYVMSVTKNAQGDFARTSDGIANQTRMTGERVKQLSADFGEKLAPAFSRLLEIGNKVLDFFNGLSDGQQKLVLVIAGVVAAIGPALMVLGNLITVIRGIGLAIAFLNAAGGPILWIIIAVLLVLAGIALIIMKNWGTIKTFFINLWTAVSSAFSRFIDWVQDVFAPVVEAIKSIWEGITKFFVGLWNGVVGVFTAVVNFFKTWGLTILAVIFWPFSLAVGLIIANWETIKGFFQGVWNFIKAVFTPVIAFYAAIFTGAWNAIVAVWNFAVSFFQTVWNGIVAIFSRVVAFYAGIFSAAWNAVVAVWNVASTFFMNTVNQIIQVFAPIVAWFGSIFSAAWGAITRVFSNVAGFFRGVWNSIVSIFSSIGTSVGNAISGAFRSAVNGVLSGAVNIINGLIGAINAATSTINKIPGVKIPQIGKLGVPRFYTGVRDFGGGAAIVGDVNGRGGEIVSLPRGSDVFSNRESKNILRSLADGGGGGMTFNNYGTIKNETPEASAAFWDRMNRISELAMQGVPTNG